MKKTAVIAIVTLLSCIGLICLMGAIKKNMTESIAENRVWQHGSSSASPDTGSEVIGEGCIVSADFSSHLPLLVLDTDGEPIAGTGSGDSNPYVDMLLYVFDSGGENCLSGDGERLIGRIKRRGEGPDSAAKFQYRLNLMDTFGDKVKYPLLGMAAGDEWILDGCNSDASCLRNYISYNLASEIGLNSPDVRFCELLLKRDEDYEYMGIYLLVEPVEQGKGRVEFHGKRSLVGAYSYIVKRDGEDTSRPLLETWAYENGVDISISDTDRMLTLVFPKNSKATEQAIRYVTEDLSKTERMLYSDSVLSDAAVGEYLDTDSFVNYFLINEFTMNRDAGKRSTYMYKDIGGKLTMGPVWGFNDCAAEDEENRLTMDAMPIFDRLMLNSSFTERLARHWAFLRLTQLSEEEITREIRETETYLGRALARDSSRRSMLSGSEVKPQEETERLLTRLLDHGAFMDSALCIK